MTKKDLIESVAKEADISVKAAKVAVETIFNTIEETIVKGDTFTYIGFGTFSTILRSAREARNLHTGEKIKIPAKRVPKFKPSNALKEAVQKSS